MPNFYVTYGCGTKLDGCYSVITSSDYDAARETAFDVTDGKFAFLYDEQEFQGQVEKWGLRQVDLQPQR